MSTRTADPMSDIARLVLRQCGINFQRYKPRCLMRRLQVRMRAVGAADLESYARHLESTPAEMERLFDALSINFSYFNRDPDLFKLLGERVLPGLARAFPDGALRLWSAGCAAGEELYSLGILAESVLGPGDRKRVQLLGTDIDERALEEARRGVYPRTRLGFLDKSLIGQYFHPDAGSGGLCVADALRRRTEFRKADLLGRAPHRQVALICCRNVLIYFEPGHQEKVLEGLAEAMPPGGILALGRVERLAGGSRRWFDTLDAARRVYVRRGAGGAY